MVSNETKKTFEKFRATNGDLLAELQSKIAKSPEAKGISNELPLIVDAFKELLSAQQIENEKQMQNELKLHKQKMAQSCDRESIIDKIGGGIKYTVDKIGDAFQFVVEECVEIGLLVGLVACAAIPCTCTYYNSKETDRLQMVQDSIKMERNAENEKLRLQFKNDSIKMEMLKQENSMSSTSH
jgi:hypothetical protein